MINNFTRPWPFSTTFLQLVKDGRSRSTHLRYISHHAEWFKIPPHCVADLPANLFGITCPGVVLEMPQNFLLV